MAAETEKHISLDLPAPILPIRLGQDAVQLPGSSVRWQLLLVWFMRIVALLWLLQGFGHWHSILVPVPSDLETLSGWRPACLLVFAVMDLLTAVGLWLVAPWGGVIWVLCVTSQMAVIVLLPGFFPSGRIVLAVDAALLVTYFITTFQAGREEMFRAE